MNTCLTSYIRKFIKKNKMRAVILCFLSLLALMMISLLVGVSDIHIKDVMALFGFGKVDSATADVIRYARLPRIIASCLCGAALALAGLLLQAVLNNPLASPGIIGVNSGAGLFVVLAAVFFPSIFHMKYMAAFFGALFAGLLVYGIAMKTGSSRTTIIMAGIAISSIMTAGIDTVVTIKPETVMDKTAFYIGGFNAVSMEPIKYAVPCIAFALAGAIYLSSRLNILLLGDEVASSLGVNVALCRLFAIFCAALLAASAVSIGGLLGFVGLIVPHIVRAMVGSDYKWLVPFTVFLGGSFLLVCDTLARLIFMPYEVPVGIILSLLGGPFFLYLVLNKKRRLEF